ncbi:MAG: nucleotide exchange factor GrpE [Candidatus Eremiobacteraeota bacterium]|nr:nucleotide exchange factor GrpE [Candidatus Eremiobacteraeota bacterium]
MNEDTATTPTPADEPAAAQNGAAVQDGGEGDLAAELTAARAKADENYNKYLYAMADFENYKKRMERQLADIAASGRRIVLIKMLPILDNLQRALAHQDSEGLRGGLQATLRQFETALESEGVKPVDLKGRPFDPNVAEAVATQPAPDGVDEGTVLEEARRAYTIGDEILRPAQVVVAQRDPVA